MKGMENPTEISMFSRFIGPDTIKVKHVHQNVKVIRKILGNPKPTMKTGFMITLMKYTQHIHIAGCISTEQSE